MALRKNNIEQDTTTDTSEDKFAKYRTGPHDSLPDPKADNDTPEWLSVEPEDNGKGPKNES